MNANQAAARSASNDGGSGRRAGRMRLNRMPEWLALGKHREELGQGHLRELF
ncbi:hypothetical protein GTW69_03470, partial [Streptomyces sp. SID7760]|nr:hypothetical protein [Streptomyces sp. SID7760]